MSNTNEIIDILKNANPKSLVDMCKENHRYAKVCKNNKNTIFEYVLKKYNVDYKDPTSLIYYKSGQKGNVEYYDINNFKNPDGTYKFGDIFEKYFRWYNEKSINSNLTTITNIPSLPKVKMLFLTNNTHLKKIEGDFSELVDIYVRNTNVEFIRGNFPKLEELHIQQNKIKEIPKQLPNLKKIDISNNPIEKLDLSSSKNFKEIKIIALETKNLKEVILHPNVELEKYSKIDRTIIRKAFTSIKKDNLHYRDTSNTFSSSGDFIKNIQKKSGNYIDDEVEESCKNLFDNYVLLTNKQFDQVCYDFDKVYFLEKKIGEGSFGTVFRGRNKLTDKQVAIKIQKKSSKENTTIAFNHEIENLKEIISICDKFICLEGWGVYFGSLVIIMEYLDGMSLIDYINLMLGNLKEDDFFKIAHQLYDNLKILHTKGIAHTDIKPENIMIDISDPVHLTTRIIDFGLGCSLRFPCHSGGTKMYIPKKLNTSLQGRQYSDMYALALSLLELAYAVDKSNFNLDYELFKSDKETYVNTLDIPSKIKHYIMKILLYDA